MTDEVFYIALGCLSALGHLGIGALSFTRRVRLGLGERNAISKKSKWMAAKSDRFARRMARFSALPFAVIAFLLGWWGLVFFYAAFFLSIQATRTYTRRLSKQWDLWQQLGYDGPPNLQEQERKLITDQPKSNDHALGTDLR